MHGYVISGKSEYYFEYHNVLSSSSVAPVSVNGDTLYYGATNLKDITKKNVADN